MSYSKLNRMELNPNGAKVINDVYFSQFRNKRLDNLIKLYFPNIVLKDWVGEWVGRDAVVMQNKKFFENDFTLTVEDSVVSIDNDMDMVRIKTDIVIEINGETINAVDDILFTRQNKIYSITAYKR
jgi:hypothetical protein